MSTPSRNTFGRWLCIVHRPVTNPGPNISSQTVATPPLVQTVEARFEADAAEKCNVPAGGHVLVFKLADAARFDRDVQAPLVRKAADGNPYVEDVPDAELR